MSWEQVKLGDIFEIARGGSPRPIDQYITDDPNGLNWISIKDASNSSKYIYKTEKKIKPEGLHKTRLVHPNDFLLTNSMSFGRPYIMKTTGCIHDGWLVLSADKTKVDTDYFYHLLGSDFMYRKFTGLAAGAVVKNLNTELVKSVSVPLPPLAEQRRIASILDQADELRQKRQQAIEKLDQLLQATFIEMFGDPVSNPKGWDKKLLSDLVTIDAPLVEPMEKEFENLLHYGPDRISKDSGKLLPALTAKEDMLISKKFLCDDRHILYSKIRPYLNKVAMVQEKCLCSADVYPVEPKSQLTKHFLWHILRSKSFLDHAETFSNRANIPKINRNQFLQYECIVPTMEAQQKFENISKDIQRQIDFQNLSLELIEKLFSSLQNQAFNGTL